MYAHLFRKNPLVKIRPILAETTKTSFKGITCGSVLFDIVQGLIIRWCTLAYPIDRIHRVRPIAAKGFELVELARSTAYTPPCGA